MDVHVDLIYRWLFHYVQPICVFPLCSTLVLHGTTQIMHSKILAVENINKWKLKRHDTEIEIAIHAVYKPCHSSRTMK